MSEAHGAEPHESVSHATNQRLDRLTQPLGPSGDWPLDVFPPEVATHIANSAASARVPACGTIRTRTAAPPVRTA